MECRVFMENLDFLESGNFEAQHDMEKLDFDKLWAWRIYRELDLFFNMVNMEIQDFEASGSQCLGAHTVYTFFYIMHKWESHDMI